MLEPSERELIIKILICIQPVCCTSDFKNNQEIYIRCFFSRVLKICILSCSLKRLKKERCHNV